MAAIRKSREVSESPRPSSPAPGHRRSVRLRGSRVWNPGTQVYRGTWKVEPAVAPAEVRGEARGWSSTIHMHLVSCEHPQQPRRGGHSQVSACLVPGGSSPHSPHCRLHPDEGQRLREQANPCSPGGPGSSTRWSGDEVLLLSLPEPPGSRASSHPSSHEET